MICSEQNTGSLLLHSSPCVWPLSARRGVPDPFQNRNLLGESTKFGCSGARQQNLVDSRSGGSQILAGFWVGGEEGEEVSEWVSE